VKTYDPNLPLFSLHVPKCAGVSFSQVLAKWFGNRLRFHYWRGPIPPKRQVVSGGDCVHGHFNSARGIGLREIYPEAAQFITILRDPLEAAISLFHYSGRGRTGETLDAFLWKARDPVLNFLPIDQWRIHSLQGQLKNNFVHVGIVERLAEDVAAIAKKLGKPAAPVFRANVTPRRFTCSAHARDAFYNNNPIAYDLYNWVRAARPFS
jgi:hypothetical protein